MSELINWVRKNGGYVSEKLTLKELDFFGNCLCANQPIEPGQLYHLLANESMKKFSGEKIIEIPQKMFINLFSCFSNLIFLDYCTK